MDPEQTEGISSKETNSGLELERLCQKYNVDLQILPHTFTAKTTLPINEARQILEQYGTLLTGTDGGVDVYNTYSAVAGFFIKKVYPNLPQTRLEIGELPAPIAIKKLTFLGETMTDQEALTHKMFHEMSHVVIFYEMLDALEVVHPGANLDDSIKYYDTLTTKLRESPRPLSQFDQISKSDGSGFYSQDELFYEDLAEALAIKFSGNDQWDRYKNFISGGSSELQRYTGDIIKLIDTISEKSKA